MENEDILLCREIKKTGRDPEDELAKPTSSLLASHWLCRGGDTPRANFPISVEGK